MSSVDRADLEPHSSCPGLVRAEPRPIARPYGRPQVPVPFFQGCLKLSLASKKMTTSLPNPIGIRLKAGQHGEVALIENVSAEAIRIGPAGAISLITNGIELGVASGHRDHQDREPQLDWSQHRITHRHAPSYFSPRAFILVAA